MGYISNAIGAYGETEAEKYLKKKKFKILDKNYSCRLGEIDLIAKDRKYIVFVEVKARATAAYGMPSEFVTASKQRKIKLTAEYYLKDKHLTGEPCRFDVVEILDGEINHIENAF